MKAFKDNFSKQSDLYLRYRPLYPQELYAFLASLTVEHHQVWDCGTGNGQAAIGLVDFYSSIIATDPSEQQIKNAIPHPSITYLIEKAENTSIPSNTIDLATTANALHWFDFDAYYSEVKRLLKPGGIIAVWAYPTPVISNEIDPIVLHYHDHFLNDYWLPENRLVENRYKDIPFPFKPVATPEFKVQKQMHLDDFIGFLNTWSATQRFINKNKWNPTEDVKKELRPLWQDIQTVTWDLVLKVGRLSTP